jgi:GNAT superfamily N-acetyltransferase
MSKKENTTKENTFEMLPREAYQEILDKKYGPLIKSEIEKITDKKIDVFFAQDSENKGFDISFICLVTTLTTNNTYLHRQGIASFSFTFLPGNCGIVISYHVSTNALYRGKGIGQLLHQIRLDIFKDMGFSRAICTTNGDSLSEEHILKKFGWVENKENRFVNKRSDHEIKIWHKDL